MTRVFVLSLIVIGALLKANFAEAAISSSYQQELTRLMWWAGQMAVHPKADEEFNQIPGCTSDCNRSVFIAYARHFGIQLNHEAVYATMGNKTWNPRNLALAVSKTKASHNYIR